MYKATLSFTTTNYDVRKNQIINQDFITESGMTEAEITEYLNIGYLVEYDGTLEITQNGLYDVKSYEQADVNVSGGVTPTGTINITENGTYDVTDYANANVNIAKNVTITTIMDNDASKVHNHITEIPMIDTSAVTNANQMFQGYQQLTTIPLIDTSSCTTMQYMFSRCLSLQVVPILDTHLVTSFSRMFENCTSLTNQSLDNILVMCINATSYTNAKRLSTLSIKTTDYSQELIESLPHYQEFIDAGWTIS